MWWPAAVAGALIWSVALHAGQHAVGVLTDLVESVIDLHAAALSRAVGVDCPGAASLAIGEEVTRRLRKGS